VLSAIAAIWEKQPESKESERLILSPYFAEVNVENMEILSKDINLFFLTIFSQTFLQEIQNIEDKEETIEDFIKEISKYPFMTVFNHNVEQEQKEKLLAANLVSTFFGLNKM